MKSAKKQHMNIVDIRLRPRCAIPPLPLAADNKLVQRLQSSVGAYRVHAAGWTSPIRNSLGVRLVGHMFPPKTAPSPSRIVTHT